MEDRINKFSQKDKAITLIAYKDFLYQIRTWLGQLNRFKVKILKFNYNNNSILTNNSSSNIFKIFRYQVEQWGTISEMKTTWKIMITMIMKGIAQMKGIKKIIMKSSQIKRMKLITKY